MAYPTIEKYSQEFFSLKTAEKFEYLVSDRKNNILIKKNVLGIIPSFSILSDR